MPEYLIKIMELMDKDWIWDKEEKIGCFIKTREVLIGKWDLYYFKNGDMYYRRFNSDIIRKNYKIIWQIHLSDLLQRISKYINTVSEWWMNISRDWLWPCLSIYDKTNSIRISLKTPIMEWTETERKETYNNMLDIINKV